MGNFTIGLTVQQELFSIAWLYAIASVAGYSIEITNVDYDSVDANICQKGDGKQCPDLDMIRVQLKCTYSRSPKSKVLKYPLSVKNYDDLRGKRAIPRILIVLHIPSNDANSWINHDPKQLTLYNCAYWTSLKDQTATTNKKTVTVAIPLQQIFTVDNLRKMMELAAQGKGPENLL